MLYVATDARGIVIDWARHADADDGWLGPKYRYGEISAWFGPEPVIGKPLGDGTVPTPPDVVCQCGGTCASCIAARDLKLTERHPKRVRTEPPIDWKKLRRRAS